MNDKFSRRDFLVIGSVVAWACNNPGIFSSPLQTQESQDDLKSFVTVSNSDPHYFELSNGRPYIPIGLNMVYDPGNRDDDLMLLENVWFKKFKENRINFVRFWISSKAFEIETGRSGNIDANQVRKLDKLFALARQYGVRVKLCTEHFRHLGEGNQPWAARAMYLKENGGPAENTTDFFTGEAGRAHYKKKLQWYADRYGSDPIVFGWELWNEMDAVNRSGAFWIPWTTEMLAELRRLFPKNLVVQSLGSFDHTNKKRAYETLCRMPDNDVLQVHRYLDLGAQWDICHASVAELASQAVRELLSHGIPKPTILAESGAVEPGHSGPFKLYQRDKAGIILHDVLFAPFFSGAAGSGHCWHWDSYIQRNNLWHLFDRFASTVEGIDPAAEQFEPFELEHDRLFLYGLKGKTKSMIWCRDKRNTWKTELEEGTPPEELADVEIPLPETLFPQLKSEIKTYDPWANRRQTVQAKGSSITLPSFSRSVVVYF